MGILGVNRSRHTGEEKRPTHHIDAPCEAVRAHRADVGHPGRAPEALLPGGVAQAGQSENGQTDTVWGGGALAGDACPALTG